MNFLSCQLFFKPINCLFDYLQCNYVELNNNLLIMSDEEIIKKEEIKEESSSSLSDSSSSENKVVENLENETIESRVGETNESQPETTEPEEEYIKTEAELRAERKALKKKKTIEDNTAMNLRDLLCMQHEYKRDDKGNLHTTLKTKLKVGMNSLQFAFSLVNTVVGAGMLSFSKTAKQMGIIGYTALVLSSIVYLLYSW